MANLRQPPNRRRLDQRLPHLPRHLQLLRVRRRRRGVIVVVRPTDALLQRVRQHLADFVRPVQHGQRRARDEVPAVQGEVRVCAEGGEEGWGGDGGEVGC